MKFGLTDFSKQNHILADWVLFFWQEKWKYEAKKQILISRKCLSIFAQIKKNKKTLQRNKYNKKLHGILPMEKS